MAASLLQQSENDDSLSTLRKAGSFVSSMLEKVSERVTLDTLRPIQMFLGVTGPSFCFSPDAFNPPTKKIMDKNTVEKVGARIRLNLAFFLSNYALIVSGVSVVVTLMNIEMIMYVGLVCSFWWVHILTVKKSVRLWKVIDDNVSVSTRTNCLYVFTLIVALYYCLTPLCTTLMISGFLIFSHALMRDPKHIESSSSLLLRGHDDEDESGESSGEEVMVERGDIC